MKEGEGGDVGVAAAAAGGGGRDEEMKGWLFKWTNYLKGYQRRWFVLRNGLLSYYRSMAEMAHTCRGTISLHGALINTEDSCNFVVSNGGGTQTFHLRASSEIERQRWVTALEFAKAMDSGKPEDSDSDFENPVGGSGGGSGKADERGGEEGGSTGSDKRELLFLVKNLGSKLEVLHTCHDLILKQVQALQKALTDLESGGGEPEGRLKNVNERATLFKITCNAMIKASADFLELSNTHGRRWQKVLSYERENRQKLEDMVEQMAKQHSHLETQVRKEIQDHPDHHAASKVMSSVSPVSGSSSTSNHQNNNESSDEDEFVDAVDEHEIDFTVPVPPGFSGSRHLHRRTDSNVSAQSENRSDDTDDVLDPDGNSNYSGDEDNQLRMQFNVIQRKSKTDVSKEDEGNTFAGSSSATPVKSTTMSVRNRRSRIPNKPDISFSLWSIMKNCIGKDLTKIPVPVNFAEPLSMLQRLVEDFEYSEILDKALAAADDREQLLYVAAFTVSAYSTTAIRVGKPFNPLLGETYECDRSDDKGFRSVSEQVSHHPPMVAQYCESVTGSWRYWQEFTMRSKFRGKYLEVEPLGIAHLEFPKSGNHYTWRKVKTLVHNFVLGKLWIDQMGEMEIINHKTGDKCHMKFEPYSYFGGCAKNVTGTITPGSNGSVEWVINGKWDSRFEGSRVLGETHVRGKSSLEIGAPILLWKVNPPAPESVNYYNFSKFACELNEIEDGVAPTDSRLRPDQRLMENGQWDEANTEKVRLEEKQRAARKRREIETETAIREGRTVEPYSPIWFKKEKDIQNGEKFIHVFQGKYWESKAKQDWSACPDIF